jgi:hypothetical protein
MRGWDLDELHCTIFLSPRYDPLSHLKIHIHINMAVLLLPANARNQALSVSVSVMAHGFSVALSCVELTQLSPTLTHYQALNLLKDQTIAMSMSCLLQSIYLCMYIRTSACTIVQRTRIRIVLTPYALASSLSTTIIHNGKRIFTIWHMATPKLPICTNCPFPFPYNRHPLFCSLIF